MEPEQNVVPWREKVRSYGAVLQEPKAGEDVFWEVAGTTRRSSDDPENRPSFHLPLL